jgi:hypothetical protein
MFSVPFLLLLCNLISSLAFEDEFVVRGPGDLHKAALDAIMEERRANPGQEDVFSAESDMMMKAKEYAIHRFMTKPDEALKVSVRELLTDIIYSPCNSHFGVSQIVATHTHTASKHT